MNASDRLRAPAAAASWAPAKLAWRLWYAGWKPGPVVPDPDAPVFVSITDFRIHRPRHALGAWRTGVRLRRSWPRLAGAIGLWLWGEPLRLRSGSVSVWQSQDDLSRFLRSPVHRAIVRGYRGRMGGTSHSWIAPRLDRAAIWARAVSELSRAPATDRPNSGDGLGYRGGGHAAGDALRQER